MLSAFATINIIPFQLAFIKLILEAAQCLKSACPYVFLRFYRRLPVYVVPGWFTWLVRRIALLMAKSGAVSRHMKF
jgi:hypothetical protein